MPRIKRKTPCLNLTVEETETQGHIKGKAKAKPKGLSTTLNSECIYIYVYIHLLNIVDSMLYTQINRIAPVFKGNGKKICTQFNSVPGTL